MPKGPEKLPATLICTVLRCGRKHSYKAPLSEMRTTRYSICEVHGRQLHIVMPRGVVSAKERDDTRINVRYKS